MTFLWSYFIFSTPTSYRQHNLLQGHLFIPATPTYASQKSLQNMVCRFKNWMAKELLNSDKTDIFLIDPKHLFEQILPAKLTSHKPGCVIFGPNLNFSGHTEIVHVLFFCFLKFFKSSVAETSPVKLSNFYFYLSHEPKRLRLQTVQTSTAKRDHASLILMSHTCLFSRWLISHFRALAAGYTAGLLNPLETMNSLRSSGTGLH